MRWISRVEQERKRRGGHTEIELVLGEDRIVIRRESKGYIKGPKKRHAEKQ